MTGGSGFDLCACKRGVFTLRDCGHDATTSCSICTRRVCDEHLAPRVDAKVCVECAAKQEEGQAPGVEPAAGQAAAVQPQGLSPTLQPLDPTSSAVRWRTRYYRDRNYMPMYWATYDPYWNDYGYRWYGDDDDDDDAGGFGDS